MNPIIIEQAHEDFVWKRNRFVKSKIWSINVIGIILSISRDLLLHAQEPQTMKGSDGFPVFQLLPKCR